MGYHVSTVDKEPSEPEASAKVPTPANLPPEFEQPKELWLLVDPENGQPIDTDIDHCHYVSFSVQEAYAAAKSLMEDSNVYAVPIRVF